MNEAVLEVVEFRSSAEMEAVLEAASAMEPWLRAQPGFRWRRLAILDVGNYLDCIEWSDMASAKAAADQVMTAAPAASFMAMIDGPSVIMRHASMALSQ